MPSDYVLIKFGTSRTSFGETTLLETNDKQTVIAYLLDLDIKERDTVHVNGISGGEWLYDNHIVLRGDKS